MLRALCLTALVAATTCLPSVARAGQTPVTTAVQSSSQRANIDQVDYRYRYGYSPYRYGYRYPSYGYRYPSYGYRSYYGPRYYPNYGYRYGYGYRPGFYFNYRF